MRNEFTAIIERDENWYIAFCPEIPGANGQGKTQEEARGSLAESIALILEDRREEGLRRIKEVIDRVLAKHYGFTDEELDSITNYDIKYRMGLGGKT